MIDLVRASVETIQELEYILNNLDEQTYGEIGTKTSFSVGRHLRHIVGFYIALQKSNQDGVADYTVRQRNNVIETDLSIAKEQVESIKNWLPTLEKDKSIQVKTEIQQSQTVDLTITSSLIRELAYISEHSIHHMAYINLMLKTMGINLEKEVGVAPSTASYLRNQKANA
ncbi:hypothetical protein [Marinicellulosiphila megalodicopiae]|uniref:hypothetical protein n=1 Tax=Marinicellulosiphila megalodicopiae TaxID=2724896 RepID=UPI003BAEEFAC